MSFGSDPASPDPLIGQAALKNSETAAQALSWYQDIYTNDIAPRQEKLDKLNGKVTRGLLTDMEANREFAAEMRDEWRDTYRPVERQAAEDAMGYDSQDRIQRGMGMASANVKQAFSGARSSAVQELAKYGLSPNSGAFAATMRRLSTAQALGDAAARTNFAVGATDKAIALRAGVADRGRGLQAGAVAASGASTAAGTGATGSSVGVTGAANAGINVAGQGFTTSIAGNNSAGQIMNNQYSTQVQASSQNPFMEMLGAGVGIYGAIKSSKKFKDRNESLEGDDVLGKIRGLKVDRWGYKGDQQLHVGPYAEELHQKFGVGNGTEIGPTDVGGVALAGVKQLDAKLDMIAKRMGINMETQQ